MRPRTLKMLQTLIFDLAARKGFAALKAEIDKQDINKLVKILTSSNNVKTKVDDKSKRCR